MALKHGKNEEIEDEGTQNASLWCQIWCQKLPNLENTGFGLEVRRISPKFLPMRAVFLPDLTDPEADRRPP